MRSAALPANARVDSCLRRNGKRGGNEVPHQVRNDGGECGTTEGECSTAERAGAYAEGMPHRLLIATGNQGKLREFRQLFAAHVSSAWDLAAPADVGLADFTVVEDGDTYAANAGRKARAYANASGLPALADDSGLEVDALDGAPGLFSARYAGDDADDAANRAKLLAALAAVPPAQRTARFRCVVALAFPFTTNLRLGEGVVDGAIALDERGALGFGYDSLFALPDGRRFAELETAEKNLTSHRARALANAAWALDNLAQTLDKST